MAFFPDIGPIQEFRVIRIWGGSADRVSPERKESFVNSVAFLATGKQRLSFITGHNTPIPIKEDNRPTHCYKHEEVNKSHCHCPSSDPGLNVNSYSGPNLQPKATQSVVAKLIKTFQFHLVHVKLPVLTWTGEDHYPRAEIPVPI
jgi:hypothetical protein